MIVTIMDNWGKMLNAKDVIIVDLERLILRSSVLLLTELDTIDNYPILERIVNILKNNHLNTPIRVVKSRKKINNFIKGLLFKAKKLGVNVI